MVNKKYGSSIDDLLNSEYIIKEKSYKKFDYNLNNIVDKISDISKDYKIKKDKNYFKYDINSMYSSKIPLSSIPSGSTGAGSGINWGDNIGERGQENAYTEPTREEVQRVMDAVHRVMNLPERQQRQLVEATKEIRFYFDGQIRARFGATNHYNAIRCLNDPTVTRVPSMPEGVQLAGEEFFALNRFMPNFADVADIQWWAVYQNGSWQLDTWNPQGEHLDTGVNGWGQLIGSVMKLNGKVLTPEEMVAFHRAIRFRNERGLLPKQYFDAMKGMLTILRDEGSLPGRFQEHLETAYDFGLVEVDGKTLTYAGQSMIAPVTARQRKQRQLTERDPKIRGIVVPTIFNHENN
jgi:hypothetical protein